MLAEELFKAYMLKQVLVDGFFHADPHPGNIFLTDDGYVRPCWDLSMVDRVSQHMQENLVAPAHRRISEGNGDEAVKIVIRISETDEDFDETEFRKKAGEFVAEQRNQTLGKHDVGMALLEVARTAARTGLCMCPPN